MFPRRIRIFYYAVQALAVATFLIAILAAIQRFYSDIKKLAELNNMDIWYYLLSNIGETLAGPGNNLFVAIIGLGGLVSSISIAYGSMRREEYLRHAFGAGLWRGYSKNFLDRVSKSFVDEGSLPPRFVLASPSYDVVGSLNFGDFVDTQLPAALQRKGYALESLYGNGKPAFYRQAFRVNRSSEPNDQALNRPIFFDFPTTFISFEGAVDAVMKQRNKALTDDEKSELFDMIKKDFFDAAERWAADTGAPVTEIVMRKRDVAAFADDLARVLDRATAKSE